MDEPRPQPARDDQSFSVRDVSWFGLVLVLLGVAWLGGMLGWWRFNWSWAGPIALIAVGLCMTFGRRRWRHRRW